jgi:glutamate-1-semialdehyde 2,1-aminomutase
MLDDAFYASLSARAERLGTGFRDAIGSAGLPIVVPVVGPLLGLHFAETAAIDYDSAKGTDEALYAAFFHAMLARGVALAPGAYEVVFPSIMHTDQDLDRVIDLASIAAREVASRR